MPYKKKKTQGLQKFVLCTQYINQKNTTLLDQQINNSPKILNDKDEQGKSLIDIIIDSKKYSMITNIIDDIKDLEDKNFILDIFEILRTKLKIVQNDATLQSPSISKIIKALEVQLLSLNLNLDDLTNSEIQNTLFVSNIPQVNNSLLQKEQGSNTLTQSAIDVSNNLVLLHYATSMATDRGYNKQLDASYIPVPDINNSISQEVITEEISAEEEYDNEQAPTDDAQELIVLRSIINETSLSVMPSPLLSRPDDVNQDSDSECSTSSEISDTSEPTYSQELLFDETTQIIDSTTEEKLESIEYNPSKILTPILDNNVQSSSSISTDSNTTYENQSEEETNHDHYNSGIIITKLPQHIQSSDTSCSTDSNSKYNGILRSSSDSKYQLQQDLDPSLPIFPPTSPKLAVNEIIKQKEPKPKTEFKLIQVTDEDINPVVNSSDKKSTTDSEEEDFTMMEKKNDFHQLATKYSTKIQSKLQKNITFQQDLTKVFIKVFSKLMKEKNSEYIDRLYSILYDSLDSVVGEVKVSGVRYKNCSGLIKTLLDNTTLLGKIIIFKSNEELISKLYGNCLEHFMEKYNLILTSFQANECSSNTPTGEEFKTPGNIYDYNSDHGHNLTPPLLAREFKITKQTAINIREEDNTGIDNQSTEITITGELIDGFTSL